MAATLITIASQIAFWWFALSIPATILALALIAGGSEREVGE